ncbi:zf-HC2 domain-containing protein [Peptoniphilus equinus]|uniref:Anti-sigma-W factor RsiW n=1 Tax=Peptoniphilus equinus TaxID=3016343 RepID=A0ABY7QRF3_9FIRM|nr:zf-HC2 domain-containing protein [Peptoniphilus equinus]WBW49372.1 zf-HC2 domain-containing protein [Peptoniphilus equinus]
MIYDCDVIQDLLPIYVDDAISESSRKLVDEHINECEECRELLEMIKVEHKKEAGVKRQYETHVKNYAKRMQRRKRIIIASLVALFCVGIIGASVITYFAVSDPFDYLAIDLGTYEEAEEFIEQGKIPAIMPKTAEHISFIYQLKHNKKNGKFHVTAKDARKMKEELEPATVDHLRASGEALDGIYNQVKSTLEDSPEGVTYYQDTDFVYAFITDGTVYYFGK